MPLCHSSSRNPHLASLLTERRNQILSHCLWDPLYCLPLAFLLSAMMSFFFLKLAKHSPWYLLLFSVLDILPQDRLTSPWYPLKCQLKVKAFLFTLYKTAISAQYMYHLPQTLSFLWHLSPSEILYKNWWFLKFLCLSERKPQERKLYIVKWLSEVSITY